MRWRRPARQLPQRRRLQNRAVSAEVGASINRSCPRRRLHCEAPACVRASFSRPRRCRLTRRSARREFNYRSPETLAHRTLHRPPTSGAEKAATRLHRAERTARRRQPIAMRIPVVCGRMCLPVRRGSFGNQTPRHLLAPCPSRGSAAAHAGHQCPVPLRSCRSRRVACRRSVSADSRLRSSDASRRHTRALRPVIPGPEESKS
jgi:hypothetical protein